MDILGATSNLVESGKNAINTVVDSGPASGLSSAVDSVTGALGSVGGFLTSLSKGSKMKLPIPNVLSQYASYDYVLSLSVLSVKELNFPDSTYKAGKRTTLILKSAGADPSNRVKTAYGKYDFFMDNLKFETLIGPHNPKSTNVTTLQFDVLEPYSLGVFMLSLQTAAYNAGYMNWRDAPFLITIEFRGSKETGKMELIPGCTRHIPVKFTRIFFKANEQGSSYNVNAFAIQNQSLTVEHSSLKTDVTIKGKTVQEVLQTGEQSLQAVINQKLKEYVKNGDKKVADQVVIMFPTDPASAATAAGASPTLGNSATINPKLESSTSSIMAKLGVIESTVNQTYIQPDGQVNVLGAASMGYSLERKGDTTTSDETAVYNEKTGSWTRGNITSNVNEGSLKFAQDIDIPSVINQVMLLSQYPEAALKSNASDANGMITWWSIDTQVYYIETNANMSSTGTMPKIMVYRVLPYKAHASKLPSQNTPTDGIANIKKQIVKSYDYIYTGKNTEVLKFDIDFSINFTNILAADSYKNTIDKDRAAAESNAQKSKKEETDIKAEREGKEPSKVAGATTSQAKYSGTSTSNEGVGGGGRETEANRAARIWHDAMTNPNDMINLNMDINGDPFWIANSGQGNYTSKQSAMSKDLCVDGTVNWQTSEVDILMNFRSPFDINQNRGLYDFGPNSKQAPVMGFKGLYCVRSVTNLFRNGVFRQTLKGFRRPLSELEGTPQKGSSVTSDTPAANTGGDRGTRGGA